MSADITRRGFLRRTFFGAALLTVSGTALRHLTGYHLDEKLAARLRVLSEKEALILAAVSRRILASDEPDAAPAKPLADSSTERSSATSDEPSADDLGVVQAADAYLANLGEAAAPAVSDLKSLLHLFEHSPFLWNFFPSRFTRLGPADQDRVLAGWAESHIDLRRRGFVALKTLAMLGYYGDPRTFAMLGYVPMTLR